MTTFGIDAGCYVYKPDKTKTASIDYAREVDHEYSKERRGIFHRMWSPAENVLQNVLAEADAPAVNQICDYLASTKPQGLARIPTGLITTTTAGSLFTKVKTQAEKDILFISVPAAQCANLKAVLRCIASAVTVKTETRLLNYDLDALKIFMDAEQYAKVVLYFSNGESLHGGILSDLIGVLDAYKTRIPLVLFFETAVSVELFQEKLTRRALQQLSPKEFATSSSRETVEQIFKSLIVDDSHRLLVGANPALLLLDRQEEHMQSAQSFVQEIKYMYMMHCRRSALSTVFEGPDGEIQCSAHVIDAARQSKSFKAHIEDLKKNKGTKKANELLKNDAALKALLTQQIPAAQEQIRSLLQAARLLKIIHEHASAKGTLPWSTLYFEIMSDQLPDSTLESARQAFQTAPSDKMTAILARLTEFDFALGDSFKKELDALLETCGDQDVPLRTQHDKSHEVTRTTVVASRVTLTKHRTALSKGDEAYSAFVSKVEGKIFDLIYERLLNPRVILFNEVYIFDLRIPIREAFTPRPRNALEHALTVPGAYLACDCCDPDKRGLTSDQPAIAILYQLYLESGAIINIADLWSAFDAVAQVEHGESGVEGEDANQCKLALFYRALAELKYLGMIKSSRKRADHLVKVKFIGL